jgi:hypothetical protein
MNPASLDVLTHPEQQTPTARGPMLQNFFSFVTDAASKYIGLFDPG